MTQSLSKALTSWPEWDITIDRAPEVIRALNQGLSHQSYLLQAGQHKLVLKIESESSRQLAMSRTEELHWLTWTQDLSPQLVWQAPSIMVYNYIDLPTWQPHQHIPQLAKTLAKLHSIPTGNHPQPLDLTKHMQRYWLQLVGQSSVTVSAHKAAMHQFMLRHIQQALHRHPQKTLCHNDLIPENILITADACVFLDWEYAAINCPAFDLATVFENAALNIEAQRHFLSVYQQYRDDSIELSQLKEQVTQFIPIVLYLQWLWLQLKQGTSQQAEQIYCRLQPLINNLSA